MIRKNYPTPQVRLDYWGGTSGTFSGWDNFGRVVSQDWVSYNGTAFEVFKINHGYDRDSNASTRPTQRWRPMRSCRPTAPRHTSTSTTRWTG
jgi:hypothetical protein